MLTARLPRPRLETLRLPAFVPEGFRRHRGAGEVAPSPLDGLAAGNGRQHHLRTLAQMIEHHFVYPELARLRNLPGVSACWTPSKGHDTPELAEDPLGDSARIVHGPFRHEETPDRIVLLIRGFMVHPPGLEPGTH